MLLGTGRDATDGVEGDVAYFTFPLKASRPLPGNPPGVGEWRERG